MKILKNTVVSLLYELSDGEGLLLEKSNDPVSYLHGGYDGIFPAVEEALQGKEVGAQFNVTMGPEEAFGEYEHELVRVEPRSLFPENVEIGMRFEGGAEGTSDDDFMLFTVVDITDDEVTVDGNHPLAGKTLNFVGTVTEVRSATPEELTHGHSHGLGGHHH
ncbi:MAG: peptidylprolyl isomerase [Gallionellaceae bacterium]